ncbi:UDP-N-acetylglucosamine 1-carboxyvinyltransferase [Streptomyces sp. NPDC001902]
MTDVLTTSPAVTVRPGRPLAGLVTVDGSKNAALPLLAAAAATRRTVHLDNVPGSADVTAMLTLLQRSGYQLTRSVSHPHALALTPPSTPVPVPELPEAARIRASYYLVPGLLASCGQARLPWPGGCQIGERGMEVHFQVYSAFGDKVDTGDGGYQITAAGHAPGEVSVELPFRSRGASVVAVLRAVVGAQRLRLTNPNHSPEFTGMLRALTRTGWGIDLGTDTLTVDPPAHRGPSVTWTVPGDKIEAGTLSCAIAASGGSGRIEGVRGDEVAAVVAALNLAGIPAACEHRAVVVHGGGNPTGRALRAVASLSPGGLDADFEPALLALALGLPGTHLFAGSINPGRHGNLLPQLARLGASFEELSPTQCCVTGPQRLTGAAVEATDIRTGSALMVAALTARGTTTIRGLGQLQRGHADLPAKLRALGADLREVTA